MDTMNPLNVYSRSDEEIGREMSNFTLAPFVLDDVEFASFEAFYAWLLLSDRNETRRDKVRKLWGFRAMNEAPKTKPETVVYRGEVIKLGSEEFIALCKRALRAKLECNPGIASRFVATMPRPIVHNTGRPPTPNAEFPREVFCRLLTELREEFADRMS